MKTLLIVYHSMTGGTRQMVDAAARGAAQAVAGEREFHVSPKHASEANATDVLDAAGYLFATPENLAAVSGMLKDFFDRVYYPALDRLEGRPYASMICAGSDGRNAARQIERIATGWRLKAISAPLIVCTHAQSAEPISMPKRIRSDDLKLCEELGATLSAGMALGIY